LSFFNERSEVLVVEQTVTAVVMSKIVRTKSPLNLKKQKKKKKEKKKKKKKSFLITLPSQQHTSLCFDRSLAQLAQRLLRPE
jgi:predicted RNA-binding protein with RPS1 domain